MQVKYSYLDQQFADVETYFQDLRELVSTGQFTLGPFVEAFERKFAAYIGVDWADSKHDVCLQVAGSDSQSLSVLKHSPHAIDEWARGLQARFPRGRFAVCLELAKGPLVFALAKYGCFVLFPVNPQTLAGYRKAFYPSGAKDDPVDAELQLEFLLRHGDTLVALEPQSPTMRKLEQLVASRRL